MVILSTARKISVEEVKYAKDLIESWGYRVKLGNTIGAEDHQFAGNEQLRMEDLQNALNDPNVKAIFCARGGYGSARILDGLDLSKFVLCPKWLIGYSDITALHALIASQSDVPSMHASMPINYKTNSRASLESIKLLLEGRELSYEIISGEDNFHGEASGTLHGGNLSMIYSLTGTPYQLPDTPFLLFLEDLDEYLYHIDRMMVNLKLGGVLDRISGLIVGGLTDMNDNSTPFGSTAKEIIRWHINHLNIPVCFDFPAGHLDNNLALLMNRHAHLKIDSKNVYLNWE